MFWDLYNDSGELSLTSTTKLEMPTPFAASPIKDDAVGTFMQVVTMFGRS